MAKFYDWDDWNKNKGFFGGGPGGPRDIQLNNGGGNGGNGGGDGGNGGRGGGGGGRNNNNTLAHEQNPFSIVAPPPTPGPQIAPVAPPGGGFVQFANSLGLGGPGTGIPPAGPAGQSGVTDPVGAFSGGGGFGATALGGGGAGDTSGWLFDPNSAYNGTTYAPGEYLQTDLGNKQFQDNPQAAWQYWTASHGIDPMSNRGQVARSLQSRVSDAYDAAVLNNPLLSRLDFMKGVDPQNMLNLMSPGERGESPTRFQGRGRTISRGYGGG